MAYSRSIFPEGGYDTFQNISDLPPSMIIKAQEYKTLQGKINKTQQEIERYNTLAVELQNHIISPELFNKFTDSITGIQKFFKENTEGYIDDLKIEVRGHVDNKKLEMTLYVDDAKDQVQASMLETIGIMQGKKDHFITLVVTKENEITAMVQEFDSRTARYYQRWTAQNGQIEYNIYSGDYVDIPPEAKLVLDPKDIDVVIQGTVLTPRVDYGILNNGLHDTIQLKGNAASLITQGVEVVARWHKNVGKLYFKHSSTHELGGSDELKNIQEPQLTQSLQDKINTGNSTVSTLKPSSGMWYKVIG